MNIVERLRCARQSYLMAEAAVEIGRLKAALGPSAAEAWAHLYDETVQLRAEVG